MCHHSMTTRAGKKWQNFPCEPPFHQRGNPFPESPQQIFFDISLTGLGSLAHPKPIMNKEESDCFNSAPGPGHLCSPRSEPNQSPLVTLALGRWPAPVSTPQSYLFSLIDNEGQEEGSSGDSMAGHSRTAWLSHCCWKHGFRSGNRGDGLDGDVSDTSVLWV